MIHMQICISYDFIDLEGINQQRLCSYKPLAIMKKV